MLGVILVAAGGALGAAARFGSVTLTQFICGPRFPYGTLFVNCFGAFLIGLIMNFLMERYAGSAEPWRLFLIVGFLGGYTTFSSYAWETLMLYGNGQWLAALMNIVTNNVGTLMLVLIGVKTGRLIGGMYAG
jgi:CrcB protein